MLDILYWHIYDSAINNREGFEMSMTVMMVILFGVVVLGFVGWSMVATSKHMDRAMKELDEDEHA